MKLDHLYKSGPDNLLLEISVSAWLKGLWSQLTGRAAFGPGVDPTTMPRTREEVRATGVPAIEFEREWEKAEDFAKRGDTNRAYRIMKDLADKSTLSGVRSRSHLERRAEDKNRIHVAIDLDNLKWLNTRLGHEGADEVIKTFAKILTDNFEDRRTKVYHPSGDEFAAIVNTEGMSRGTIQRYLKDLESKARKSVLELASKVFVGPNGRAKATATAAVGFTYREADILADKMKVARRKIRPGAVSKHVFMTKQAEAFIGKKT